MIDLRARMPIDAEDTVQIHLTRPESCRPGQTPGLVLAHGAANNLDHPLLTAVAEGLAGSGMASVLRFNFAYRERGAKSPDPTPILEEVFRRAHDYLADDDVCRPGPLFLGGKSLGARIAAGLVSHRHEGEGLLAAGLVFLGYPLHAPGRTEKLRTEPLARIDVPALFVQGSRDPFCRIDLLEMTLHRLSLQAELHVVENGGHGFELPGRTGRPQSQVYAEVTEVVADFISRVASRRPADRP
ncbi:MAG: hypothetical protein Kow00129_04400 [Thermoleophilia bacterium]